MELLGLGVLLIGLTMVIVNLVNTIFMIQFMKEWRPITKRLPKLSEKLLDISEISLNQLEEELFE